MSDVKQLSKRRKSTIIQTEIDKSIKSGDHASLKVEKRRVYILCDENTKR